MTPADYLSVVVLPTLGEFMAEPADQRRAYLACIAVAHLIDHVARSTKIKRGDIRAAVAAHGAFRGECFEIVEGICNGTKHAGPDRNAAFSFSPGLERRREAFAFDVEGAGLDEARWDKPGLTVVHRRITYFIDDCARATVWAFAGAYPALFSSVDLAPSDPNLDRWGGPIDPPLVELTGGSDRKAGGD